MIHKYLIHYLLPFVVLIFMISVSCSHNGQNEDHGQAGHDESEHQSDTTLHQEEGEAHDHDHDQGIFHDERTSLEAGQVLITGEQFRNAGIKLGMVEEQALSETVKAFGKVALDAQDEAHVTSVVEGEVRDIRKIEGDRVEKDETLALIEHPNIVQMQQDYLNAVNNYEYLQSEFERQERLFSDSVSSGKSFQKTRSDYLNSRIVMHGLARKLKLMNIDPEQLTPETVQSAISVKSPLSGYVNEVNVKTGSQVDPQEELFQITANDKVHLHLRVYEQDISKVKEGQSLTFNFSAKPEPKPLSGYVIRKARNFDQESRTALVHAGIHDAGSDIYPGMAVKSFIQAGGETKPCLPEQAFVEDQGEQFIFVLERSAAPHPEHPREKYYIFTRTPVKKGTKAGDYAAVYFYEEPGDSVNVAISNPQAILAEMEKSSAGHGHAH
ncbi:MAG: efflux RND transporter periplasmic adaptor subunit [Bacteroidota bacterium]